MDSTKPELGIACPHDPKQYAGMPIGMYHCPECGEMVLAGMDHPEYSILEDIEYRREPTGPEPWTQDADDPFNEGEEDE